MSDVTKRGGNGSNSRYHEIYKLLADEWVYQDRFQDTIEANEYFLNTDAGEYELRSPIVSVIISSPAGGTAAPTDTAPPLAPAGVFLSEETASSIIVNWASNSEPDLQDYRVYKSTVSASTGFSLIGIVVTPGASYLDLTFAPTSWYKVTARDNAGNESEFSETVSSATGPEWNTIDPAALTTFRTRLQDGQAFRRILTLPGDDSFNESTDGVAANWTIHRSTPYIVGEVAHIGNNVYLCTTAGTTSGSAPTFTAPTRLTMTPVSQGSNAATTADTSALAAGDYISTIADFWQDTIETVDSGTQITAVGIWNSASALTVDFMSPSDRNTTDGGVVWEWQYNIESGLNASSFEDDDSRNRRNKDGGGANSWNYYDTGNTAARMQGYFVRLGTITTSSDLYKLLDLDISAWVDNYSLRFDSTAAPGWWQFQEGFLNDYQQSVGRYKRDPVAVATDFTRFVEWDNTKTPQNFNSYSDAVHWSGSFLQNNLFNTSSSGLQRELAYAFTGDLINADINSVRSWTVDGVTDEPSRWFIPAMLEHLHRVGTNYAVNGDEVQPFYTTFTIDALDRHMLQKRAAEEDENEFVSSADIGLTPDFQWNWGGRGWTDVSQPIVDIAYEMANTWVDHLGIPYFQSDVAISNEAGWDGASYFTYQINSSNANLQHPDLNMMVALIFYVAAREVSLGNATSSWSANTFLHHADRLFEYGSSAAAYATQDNSELGSIGPGYFRGKQFNEYSRFALKGLEIRHLLTGQNV